MLDRGDWVTGIVIAKIYWSRIITIIAIIPLIPNNPLPGQERSFDHCFGRISQCHRRSRQDREFRRRQFDNVRERPNVRYKLVCAGEQQTGFGGKGWLDAKGALPPFFLR